MVAADDDAMHATGAMESERLVEAIAEHVGRRAVVAKPGAQHQRTIDVAGDTSAAPSLEDREVHGEDGQSKRARENEEKACPTLPHSVHTPDGGGLLPDGSTASRSRDIGRSLRGAASSASGR